MLEAAKAPTRPGVSPTKATSPAARGCCGRRPTNCVSATGSAKPDELLAEADMLDDTGSSLAPSSYDATARKRLDYDA